MEIFGEPGGESSNDRGEPTCHVSTVYSVLFAIRLTLIDGPDAREDKDDADSRLITCDEIDRPRMDPFAGFPALSDLSRRSFIVAPPTGDWSGTDRE